MDGGAVLLHVTVPDGAMQGTTLRIMLGDHTALLLAGGYLPAFEFRVPLGSGPGDLLRVVAPAIYSASSPNPNVVAPKIMQHCNTLVPIEVDSDGCVHGAFAAPASGGGAMPAPAPPSTQGVLGAMSHQVTQSEQQQLVTEKVVAMRAQMEAKLGALDTSAGDPGHVVTEAAEAPPLSEAVAAH